jgi:hypothetical protein
MRWRAEDDRFGVGRRFGQISRDSQFRWQTDPRQIVVVLALRAQLGDELGAPTIETYG